MEQTIAARTPPRRGRDAWYRDRRILAWAMFDFANTPYVVLVATVGFSTYFKDVVVQGARSGDFLWGLAGSISMIVVALTAPYLGALADATGSKRRLLLAYTAMAVAAIALLGTVREGMVAWGMLLFVVANVGFQGGQAFYNAFLPEVARDEDLGVASGLGSAAGYVGALISILAALPFFWNGFEEANLGNVRMLFVGVAVFFALFSIPTFAVLRDAPRPPAPSRTTTAGSLARLREDLTDLRRNRAPFRYLVSYLLYMDAITTLMAFVAIYASDTLGLSLPRILSLFLISQLTAIPGSLVLGRAADRLGAKPTITGILLLWVLILIIGVQARSYGALVIMALLAGAATGSVFTVSRSMMALLSPKDRQGEFFGFYAVAGRVSAIVGPVLFGAVSSISGNQRLALGSLLVLIVAGLAVLQTVHPPALAAPGGAPAGDAPAGNGSHEAAGEAPGEIPGAPGEGHTP
ncbi:MAG: MFS transporter [Thermoleophilia bacterium]